MATKRFTITALLSDDNKVTLEVEYNGHKITPELGGLDEFAIAKMLKKFATKVAEKGDVTNHLNRFPRYY